MSQKVITRTPPSPTGSFHIGTMRTALYNYLFAKKNGGVVLFRSEDTDTERSTKEYEQQIFAGLVAMDLLDPTTPIVRQSERTARYREVLELLLESGKAYYCFMKTEELDAIRAQQEKDGLPTRYPGTFRDYPLAEARTRVATGERAVIRLRLPEDREVKWNDLVRGEVSIHTKDMDDFVIAKGLDMPLYHLAVVVDDIDMHVTHVLRGEDHVSNTPKQILIYEAMGATLPEFGHLPLILNADKTKLSKRKNKTSVQDYLDEGYLKEALLNFVAFIGWNPGGEQEIYSLSEMVDVFSLDRVQKSGAVFNLEKLDWYNKEWMKRLSIEELAQRATQFIGETSKVRSDEVAKLQNAIAIERERAATLKELIENIEFLFATELQYDGALLVWKKSTAEDAKDKLTHIVEILKNSSESEWTKEGIEKTIGEWIDANGFGRGDVLWPLRVSLSGKQNSPGPFEIASVLGKEQTVARIEHAISLL